ncbi:hypothetical protein ACFL01_02045 [Planctomycetota bacterium]
MSPRNTSLSLTPHFKLWLSGKDAEGVFGDGKWRILEAIQEQESPCEGISQREFSVIETWTHCPREQSRSVSPDIHNSLPPAAGELGEQLPVSEEMQAYPLPQRKYRITTFSTWGESRP